MLLGSNPAEAFVATVGVEPLGTVGVAMGVAIGLEEVAPKEEVVIEGVVREAEGVVREAEGVVREAEGVMDVDWVTTRSQIEEVMNTLMRLQW